MEPSQQKFNLAVYHGARLVRQITLDDGHYRLGNDENLEIPLIYPSVSRLHGVLTVANASLQYCDLKSRNGTYLSSKSNKKILSPEIKHPLLLNEKLEIGPFSLQILRAPENREGYWQKTLEKKYQEILEAPPAVDSKAAAAALPQPSALLREWCLQGNLQGTGASAENIEVFLNEVSDEESKHGPFTPYMELATCREILANGPESLYVDIGAGLVPLHQKFRSAGSYRAWIQRLVASAGRRLDQQHPLCEGTLPNGARFQGVLAPLTTDFAAVAIRRFGGAPLTEEQAIASGWIPLEAIKQLKEAVIQRKNIVVSGGTSAGKTSLVNFLCGYINPQERLITIEDTLELSIASPHVLPLQARKPNSDGVGEVTLRQLVQCSLRMRPDRIIVGECRGAEVIEMLQAMNTGHPGSITTVHANSAGDALHRLELLTLMNVTNISSSALRQWIGRSIQLVVHVNRSCRGYRYVQEICEVSLNTHDTHDTHENFKLNTLYLSSNVDEEEVHSTETPLSSIPTT